MQTYLKSSCALALLFGFGHVASAQDGNDDLIADEIIVSGERVERSVFDTSSSVTVITGEDLAEKRTIRDARSAFDLLPNVFDADGSNSGPTFRGLQSAGPTLGGGAFFGGARPRGAVVVDGRSLSSSELSFGEVSLCDVDQIESFNGPQTTTNGTNSIAGAIFVNTNEPIFDVEGSLRGAGGNFAASNACLMFNTPIIEDQLAFRIAAERNRQDSWREAVAVAPNDDLDHEEVTMVRAKLLLEPEAIPGLSTTLTFSHSEDSGPQTLLTDPPFNRRESINPGEASFNGSTTSVEHTLEYEITDGIEITNVFGFADTERIRLADDPVFPEFGLFGEEMSNETRINFDVLDGQLTGVLGGVWVKRDEFFPFELFGNAGVREGTNESFGVFGEVTWSATDALHLTVGGRYQRDQSALFAPDIPFVIPGGFELDETYTALLPKASIAYDLTENFRIGALVSTGYNPGGASVVLGLGAREYDEEKALNFEVFTRGSFFDDRLTFSANAFHTRYEDFQVLTTIFIPGIPDPQSFVENAEKLHSYGLELNATAEVLDGLIIDGSLGLLHTEIKEFSLSQENIVGKELPRAPNVTFALGAQYDVTDAFMIGATGRYVGEYFGDTRETPITKAGNYFVVDLNASYELHENFEVFAGVSNVFNTDYTTNSFDSLGTQRAALGDPREFIIGGEIRF